MRIAIFLPAYGGKIVAQLATTIMADQAWAISNGHELGCFFQDIQPIDRSRNTAFFKAVNHNFDYMMMYDADTYADGSHSALGVLYDQLTEAQNGRHPNAAAIGAVYVHRNGQRTLVYPPLPPEVVEPIKHIGTGMMLLDLNKLESIKRNHKWFQYVLESNGQDTKAGEDVYFCDEVKNQGGVVLGSTHIPTRHLGTVEFRLETYYRLDADRR